MRIEPGRWRALGGIRFVGDDLLFPAAPAAPGLYRFVFRAAADGRVYVGEAVHLAKRFTQYRRPGPSQPTNQRINRLMRKTLEAEGTVEVAIITEARLSIGSETEVLDLSRKPERMLVEAFLVEQATGSGLAVENVATT